MLQIFQVLMKGHGTQEKPEVILSIQPAFSLQHIFIPYFSIVPLLIYFMYSSLYL